MEKNLQDDRLNDYVKKSFDDYEEDPSGDMWSRIETVLPETERPRPAFWRTYRWQLAAAVAILVLVSRLICVQTYYEEKLRGMAEQQNQVVQPLTPSPTENTNNLLSNQSISSPVDATTTPVTAAEKAPGSTSDRISATTATQRQASNTSQTNRPSDNPTKANQNASHLVEAGQDAALEPPRLINPEVPNLAPTTLETNTIQKPAAVATIPTLIPARLSLSTAENPAPGLVDAPIKRFKSRSGWYAGIAVTPHLIVEKQQTVRRPGLRPRFANHQDKPKPSADFALRVGKKLNKRWALESGVGFQQVSRTAVHQPGFRYNEGQIIQGSGAESRSFDYDLNTYGGSAAVSLRTEVSGSSAPAETDRVAALIQSNEEIQILRVPLLLTGRFGKNRLQAMVRAGLVGSYLLKNELQITTSQIENPRLRFRVGDEYTVQLDHPKKLILGYQLSMGGELRLNKNLSVAFAPTITGDFARTDTQGSKLPGHTTFGMNVGGVWWF